MGSSFTEYRGRGFWASDAVLELWLSLLADAARGTPNPPEWLQTVADEWSRQATAGLTGCVEANLDSHLRTVERVALVIHLAKRTRIRLRKWGPMLAMDWLNSRGLGGSGARFTENLPTAAVTSVAESFEQLLRDGVGGPDPLPMTDGPA